MTFERQSDKSHSPSRQALSTFTVKVSYANRQKFNHLSIFPITAAVREAVWRGEESRGDRDRCGG